DLRVGDRPVFGDRVPVVEHAAGSFGAAIAGFASRLDVDGRRCWRLVAPDQAERFVEREQQFHRTHDDAAERVRAGGAQAGASRRLLNVAGQAGGVDAVAGPPAGGGGPAGPARGAAGEGGTGDAVKWPSYSAGVMSRPPVETIRPWVIGYSAGCRSDMNS